MILIAVRVFPIKGHRFACNFDVADGSSLRQFRVGYHINRASALRIQVETAYLYAANQFAFLRVQIQDNNRSPSMISRPSSQEWSNIRSWRLYLCKSRTIDVAH